MQYKKILKGDKTMEKSKIIIVDNENKSEVTQALVIHKGIDGRYLLSAHPKTADMHWEGTSSFDADGGFVVDGYSLKKGSLYSLSKITAVYRLLPVDRSQLTNPLSDNLVNDVINVESCHRLRLRSSFKI